MVYVNHDGAQHETVNRNFKTHEQNLVNTITVDALAG